jgi:RNA polymerase sigma factor (sigma-70 family)
MCDQARLKEDHPLSLLLRRIVGGDHFAEAELCEFLGPGLRLIAQRRANTQDSEDIAQEALLAILQAARAGSIRSAEAVGAFARGVVYNLCSQKVKLLIRARLDGTSEDLAVLASTDSTPEQSALERDGLSVARKVLAELNPQQQEILRRFYLEEHTPEQICHDMGLTPTQFRLAKSRALARFAEEGRIHLMRKGRPARRSVIYRSALCA